MSGKKNSKRWVDTVCMLLLLLVFFVSTGVFLSRWRAYKLAQNSYQQLSQSVIVPADPTENETPAQTENVTEEPESKPLPIQVDFDALHAVNEDVIGWLYCPDTQVNYPVLQGQSNDTYLRRLYDGTWNLAGSLFLDHACPRDLSAQHLIIYGHNMKDGSMFHLLDSYADQEFYETHPTWYFLTPEAAYRVELFSGYETASTSSVYQLDFPEGDDWLTYLSEAQESSLFSSDISVTPEDQILTLSTCAYSFQNARFVLQGVLRKI